MLNRCVEQGQRMKKEKRLAALTDCELDQPLFEWFYELVQQKFLCLHDFVIVYSQQVHPTGSIVQLKKCLATVYLPGGNRTTG